jgi:putative Mg2+ transporter-C (MgtC) family protein
MYLEYLDHQTIAIFTKLFVAMVLGIILGVERTMAHKMAGMRTYALISMGSALFVSISEMVVAQYSFLPATNALYLPAQIVVGIGFIGGGLIFVHGNTVKGLTTAAGLWVAAGIGMAVGFGMYSLGIFVTFMTLFIFVTLWRVEEKIKYWIGVGGDECKIDHDTGEVTCK